MNKLLAIILGCSFVSQFSYAVETSAQSKEFPKDELKKQNKELVQLVAKELNKGLPQTIDKYTQLIKVEGKDTVLHYTYEINTGAKSDETVKNEDRSRMREAVTNGICKSYKKFLDAQIDISYIYISAKSKVELFHFDMTQSKCFAMTK